MDADEARRNAYYLTNLGIFLMPRNGAVKRLVRLCSALAVLLALGGCSFLAPEIAPPVEPITVPVAEPVVAEVPTKTEQQQPAKPPKPPRSLPVAIVLSSSQPAFLDVANALIDRLDDVKVFDLSDGRRTPDSVLRVINDSDSGVVVAIGLLAARSSVAMAESPVIFAQVFNHQDYGLLTANSRGIAPLAPLEAQLAAWTEIDPSIQDVGIIIGEGHDALIAEAQLAAQKHDIKLQFRIAHSDQETLYLFRRMAQNIDGLWLFPDNRILSARSIQKILETTRRGHIAVAVPNESMLDLGATISIGTQAEDIAETIAGIIRRIRIEGLQNVPDISPLSAIRVVTRGSVEVVSR